MNGGNLVITYSLTKTQYPVGIWLQVSFLALYHLLDFGSGYNPLLQAANKRTAKETVQFGAIGEPGHGKK
jgi:hypothetical protein